MDSILSQLLFFISALKIQEIARQLLTKEWVIFLDKLEHTFYNFRKFTYQRRLR